MLFDLFAREGRQTRQSRKNSSCRLTVEELSSRLLLSDAVGGTDPLPPPEPTVGLSDPVPPPAPPGPEPGGDMTPPP